MKPGKIAAPAIALLVAQVCFSTLESRVRTTGQKKVTASEHENISPVALEKLNLMIQDHIDRHELGGVVTLIVKDGDTAQLKAYGDMDIEAHKPMRTDALFRLASMNKPLTAVAALTLYDQGKFSLDDPVSKFIPEFKNLRVLEASQVVSSEAATSQSAGLQSAAPGSSGTRRVAPQTEVPGIASEGVPVQKAPLRLVAQKHEMTIRDLFRHTSGLLYGGGDGPVEQLYHEAGLTPWNGTLEEFVHRLSGIPLAYQPGSQWVYSYSIDVLGYLIEVISHQPLNEYVKAHVFTPLQMSDTDYYVPDSKLDRLTNFYFFKDGSLRLAESAIHSPYRHLPPAPSGGGGLGDAGGVVSTAEDLGRFYQMLLNYGELDGVRILRRETVEMMISDQIAHIRDRGFPVSGYGLGVGVDTRHTHPRHTKLIFWAGAPFNTHFIVDYDSHMIGILLAQTGPFGHLDLMQHFDEMFAKLSAK